jgi:hypothetical protein
MWTSEFRGRTWFIIVRREANAEAALLKLAHWEPQAGSHAHGEVVVAFANEAFMAAVAALAAAVSTSTCVARNSEGNSFSFSCILPSSSFFSSAAAALALAFSASVIALTPASVTLPVDELVFVSGSMESIETKEALLGEAGKTACSCPLQETI